MKRWQANSSLLICALLWSTSFVGVQISLITLTPFQMQYIRFLVTAAILVIFLKKRFFKIKKEVILAAALISIVFFLGMSLQTYSLKFTTISKSAFITVTSVIFVPILLFVFTKKKIENYLIGGILVMLVGFFILMFKIDIFDLTGSFTNLATQLTLNIGDYLALLCAICFALHIILAGHFTKKYNPLELLTYQMLFSGMFSLMASLLNHEGMFYFNQKTFVAIVYLTLIVSLIAFGLQLYAQKYADTSEAAVLMTSEAGFAVLFSVAFGFEPYYNGLILGGLLIIVGVIIAETELSFISKKFNTNRGERIENEKMAG